MSSDFVGGCLQPGGKILDDFFLVQRGGAGENIERGEGMFWPGVKGYVTFGNDDDSAQSMWTELVEDIGHIGAACFRDGMQHRLS